MLGRRSRSLLVAALVSGSVTVMVATPVAAAPTVAVTPSSGLVDGQEVTITLTDFPDGLWAVLQCRANFDITTQSVLDHCNFLVLPTQGVPPASVAANVEATLSVSGSPIDCATVIDACKVIASTYDLDTDTYVYAEAPISFEGAVPQIPPTVTVTPTHVIDGQVVTVTAAGFPSGQWGVAQCPAWLVMNAMLVSEIFANCRWMVGPGNGVPPTSSQGVVYVGYTSIDGSRTVNCLLEAGGCTVSVGVADADITGTIVSASVPIDFGAALTLIPARGLVDGSVLGGFTSAADGDHTLAQCSAGVLDPGSGPTDARCGPATAVTVTNGEFAPSFTVAEPLVTRDATVVPCGSHGCVLVLQTGGGDLEASAAVSFGPPALATDPPMPVRPQSAVTVLASGMEGTSVFLSRCVEPISPTRCYGAATITLDAWGSGSAANVWLPTSIQAEGATHDCRVASCVLVAGDPAAPQAVLPVSFAPPPVVTLTPSTGLLDGESMRLDATGLQPSLDYTVWRCTASVSACDAIDGGLVAGPDGSASIEVTAQQRVGTYGYCRTDCRIIVVNGGINDAVATYDMAVGSLAVTPSAGLVPGQAVGLAGSSLMPTYAGPNIGPFATGGWAVAQCDVAIVGNISLGSVFRHCSLGPSLQPVTIGGATLAAGATVEGVITKILGGTTDCTAAPGTCVLGLFRLEQDASTSGYTVPLSFG